MKFNPFEWEEIAQGDVIEVERGQLHVRASADDVNVYVECEGVEVLAGRGADVDIRLAQDFRARVEAPKGARVFIKAPVVMVHQPRGEVFTNLDRKPNESGNYLEVTRELRKFKLEQHALRRQMQSERRRLEQARASSSVSSPEPEPQPDPEPDPEPASEPDPAGGDE